MGVVSGECFHWVGSFPTDGRSSVVGCPYLEAIFAKSQHLSAVEREALWVQASRDGDVWPGQVEKLWDKVNEFLIDLPFRRFEIASLYERSAAFTGVLDVPWYLLDMKVMSHYLGDLLSVSECGLLASGWDAGIKAAGVVEAAGGLACSAFVALAPGWGGSLSDLVSVSLDSTRVLS